MNSTVKLNSATLRNAMSKEEARVELVAYFGMKFDRYARQRHWRMLLVLAGWAEEKGLDHCAAQAKRAAHQIQSGRPMTLKQAFVNDKIIWR